MCAAPWDERAAPPVCAPPPGGIRPMSTGGTAEAVAYQPNTPSMSCWARPAMYPAAGSDGGDIYLPSCPTSHPGPGHHHDCGSRPGGSDKSVLVAGCAALAQLVIGPLSATGSDVAGRALQRASRCIVISLLGAPSRPASGPSSRLRVVRALLQRQPLPMVAIAVIRTGSWGSGRIALVLPAHAQ